ncbi:MAG: hypothetical protein DMG51_01265 [Acidobacteria bacterium]|nr:MAG: hypothetical protein DMG51_01265 [Acidobacteriota bacterium]
MRPPSLLLVAVLSAGPQQVAVAQQSLGNAQFQVRYSAFGVTSVTYVHDKYDTEYISAGDTLGDLLIRYRLRGENTWKRASAAALDKSPEKDQLSLSYTIGVPAPTIATSSKTSASVRFPGVFALNDQKVPKSSHDMGIPLFVCGHARKAHGSGCSTIFPSPRRCGPLRSIGQSLTTGEPLQTTKELAHSLPRRGELEGGKRQGRLFRSCGPGQ